MPRWDNIDLGNPISDHPINRGLLCWFLNLPGMRGGDTWNDLTGNLRMVGNNTPTDAWIGNTKASVGSLRMSHGMYGGLQFTNTGSELQYFSAASIPIFDALTALTVTCRVRVENNSGVNFARIFHKANGTGSDVFNLGTNSGAAPLPFWRIRNSADAVTSITGSTNMRAGTPRVYHCLAGRWRASDGSMAVFLNGESEASGSRTGTALKTNTEAFAIGAHSGSAGSRYLDGTVDDIRAYNRFLSNQELRFLRYQSEEGNPVTIRRTSVSIGFSPAAAAAHPTIVMGPYQAA